jgi:cytosine deaminase
MIPNSLASPFYKKLDTRIKELGGIFNAHLHLDRAGTLDDVYMQSAGMQILETSYISLLKKHSLITALHEGLAYEKDDLVRRVNEYLDIMVAAGTTRADTLVDVTPDRVGLSAMQTLLEIKYERANQIDVRIGAYSPMGYTDAEPERWELIEEASAHADFLGALPEADDVADYPDNIGFHEHCRRMLLLSQKLGKPVHVHVDQRNEPTECGTEKLIEAVNEFGPIRTDSEEPSVWAVHLISPSTYPEERFEKMVQGLVEANIGVICCPSAALGMRQLRPLNSPTYNSIPRVLEMLAAGVHVRLGSDNIADICSPSTTAHLMDEIFILSAALRFYQVDILAKLGAGVLLSSDDREFIRNHLARNDSEIEKVLRQAQERQSR